MSAAKLSVISTGDLLATKDYVNDVKKSVSAHLNGIESEWIWLKLKEPVQNESNKKLFQTYSQKINHGYFSLFLILEIFISLTNFFVVLFTNMNPNTLDVVVIDLIFYSVLSILPIVGLLLSESYIKNHPRTLGILTTIAFLLLFIVDILLPIYHSNLDNYRPSYTSHLILACFVFFNVSKFLYSLALALFVVITHLLILAYVTYKDTKLTTARLIADGIYLTCVVSLGIYFRLMNEIIKRKSFIDRRNYVTSTVIHKYEKGQEEQLMKSILPENIVKKVQENLVYTIEHLTQSSIDPKNLDRRYVTPYQNVTILYADIVNYTKMTSKLKPVTILVETLNDLFGAFDDESDKLNVVRIKFLGDCYYCVAGIPPKNIENHAEACVDLGLQMISIIRKVRKKRSIDIDMRIGVHTGNISSGIIGKAKWQFDIWSNDVYIANKMESTGEPGKVHITRQTKDQLKKVYNIIACDNASENDLLRSHKIQSYLISPFILETPIHAQEISNGLPKKKNDEIFLHKLYEDEDMNNIEPDNNTLRSVRPVRKSEYLTRRDSKQYVMDDINVIRRGSKLQPPIKKRITVTNNPIRRSSDVDFSKRRTAFMQNNVKFNTYLQKTDEEMEKSINLMPFSKYEQWFKMKEIHPLFLTFTKRNIEFDYIKLSDPLFPFYILCTATVLLCLVILENITIPIWDSTTLIGYLTFILTVVLLIPLTCTQYFYQIYQNRKKSKEDETNVVDDKVIENVFLNILYKSSQFFINTLTLRILIYLIICVLGVTNVVFEMLKCHYYTTTNDTVSDLSGRSYIRYMMHTIQYDSDNNLNCISPWQMTELWCLTIILSCIFLRIHIWLKITITTCVTTLYSCFIWYFSREIFQESETYNYKMEAPIAHIISTAYLTLTLHFIDRQTEYLNRLDYRWNMELKEELENVNNRRIINKLLLDNILPAHVSKEYLNLNRPATNSNKFYYKEYDNVAVMFASIIHNNEEPLDETTYLMLMDKVICSFDTELFEHKHIEKIKIANWTYMAASGLKPDEVYGNESDVIVYLLKFASKLFKCIENENANLEKFSSTTLQLRIGISHGDVTAGVVGSKKPLYDIWGDAVNMASRMDTLGEVGKIQITENTAMAIRECGVLCTLRGYIYVKGKSQRPGEPDVKTFYVELDHNNELIDGNQ